MLFLGGVVEGGGFKVCSSVNLIQKVEVSFRRGTF